MPNSNDNLYSILVKISVILTVLFSGWLIWEHFSNRPIATNEYSAANKAFKDKHYELAYKNYVKAYNLNDQDVYIIEGLARSLMELKRYEEAIDYFNLAINNDSSFAPAYANLGVLYDRIENHKKAMELYEEALRLDSEIAKGMHWLDRLLYNVQEVPPTIQDRLEYLKTQYSLTEAERILSVPEIDRDQPNYER
ncbi:MAG: hypothetical protein CFH31_00444 [Alphaproteobacteria bacterium MarineAlpha9_Bin1]|nr:MAG: hypothetical protein CFH31_00444 [Alphaproteobacteria bacterium MarineAlpha9_Bin1]